MNDGIAQLSIRALLNGEDFYVIPIYQRNYAWVEGEIHQLIKDVCDSRPAGKHYYLGTLVVDLRNDDTREKCFETVDGQQRLTTLSLLACYLRNLKPNGLAEWYGKPNLRFDSRKTSSQTLERIFQDEFGEIDEDASELTTTILRGYRIIKNYMDREFKDHEARKEFASFLFEKVQIVRVELPKKTELNHYFEIMNNRGEQLEKHEVLKARLLAKLDEADRPCFHQIWEACANMEKYVQTGFKEPGHKSLFGNDGSGFTPDSFADIRKALLAGTEHTASQVFHTLSELLEETSSQAGEKAPSALELPERFSAIVNFPNFLLLILRISFPPGDSKDMPLDDKKLIETFESSLLQGGEARARVEQFAFYLLKGRYLLDRYVIKKELSKGEERWSLKRYQKSESATYRPTFGGEDEVATGINRQVLMLLAAFHVSAPTMADKYWLSAALKYLANPGQNIAGDHVSASGYLAYLENIAKAFIFDRYLADDIGLNYFQIIEDNQGLCQKLPGDLLEHNLKEHLSLNGIKNNFVFNYLDYLLWQKHRWHDEPVKFFEFTVRSSVEHYYPQTPVSGEKGWNREDLDSFGNLCLINQRKNSQLSNQSPVAKRYYYAKNKIDSVKQFVMMKGNDPWNERRAHDHEREMIEVLRQGPPKHPESSTENHDA